MVFSSPSSLRARLAATAETGVGRKDRQLFEELNPGISRSELFRRSVANPRPAAVLIPVVLRDDEPRIVFTVRTAGMPSHAGEISFPGGGPKGGDATLTDTALRETHEEIGVGPEHVDVIGEYGVHFGGLGYAVTPVLGLIKSPPRFVPSEREVEAIFEVPLADLVNLDRHEIEVRVLNGTEFNMYSFPWNEGASSRHIWGLTAGILQTFARAWHEAAT